MATALFAHFKDSTYSKSLNVTQEDQDWAMDNVHSRSVAVPKPVSEPSPFMTSERKEKKRKVYAVRRHNGSLCTQRQPENMTSCY